jgi:hypothetical protein
MAGQMAQQMVNPQGGQFNPNAPQQQPPHFVPPQGGATPPPIPPQIMYHVAIGGVQQGPFPEVQLQQMVQQGQLTPDTLVWTQGMPAWAAANSVPAIARFFGAVPPPL